MITRDKEEDVTIVFNHSLRHFLSALFYHCSGTSKGTLEGTSETATLQKH